MLHYVECLPVEDYKDVPTEAFFTELENLLRRHNISFAHEDFEGAFILDVYSDDNVNRMKVARMTCMAYNSITGDQTS